MENDEEHGQPNNIFLFELAISNSFKQIAKSVSEDTFLNALTILSSKPNMVKKLHSAMFEELYGTMSEDFQEILKEESLQAGLERVAKLMEEDSSITEDAWRPPGDVHLHLRSLDAHKIKEESDLLEQQVKKMEEENAILMKKVADERSRVIAINEKMTRCINTSSAVTDKLKRRQEGLEDCFIILNHEEYN